VKGLVKDPLAICRNNGFKVTNGEKRKRKKEDGAGGGNERLCVQRGC